MDVYCGNLLSSSHIILKQLYDTHPGVSRMKSLARLCMVWPGIDASIVVAIARGCTICQDN